MSFISGLKGIFKRPIYVIIVFSFIAIWIGILLEREMFHNLFLSNLLIFFGALLIGFNIILLLFSFFKPFEEIKKVYFIIALILALIIAIFFRESIFLPTFTLFYLISINVNLFFTAFFAFKVCMDSSTKVDDFLYRKKKIGKILRVFEFILFGLAFWFIGIFFVGFFTRTLTPFTQVAINILRIIQWTNLFLLIIVLLRLIITKKFAAYITLFFLLAFFYVIYIIFDFLFGKLYGTESTVPLYVIGSFFVDLILFFYIIGSIYDKVDFLKNKLKLFRADTIAIFLIIMKLYVQVSKIFDRADINDFLLFQEAGLFFIFIFFTLLFGIYNIFTHKHKNRKN
ncbi:MAG: DUF2157 domain-containing protein [Promethearchaeota archaeon]|nr:MAG: DUF2157 domain-containing protein [Candidatus Lokiarchaeota archaeon]